MSKLDLTEEEKVQELLQAMKNDQTNLEVAERMLSSREHDLRAILAKKHSVEVQYIELGSWGCADSVTGKCYYDMGSPMGDDECLVCGGPDERK